LSRRWAALAALLAAALQARAASAASEPPALSTLDAAGLHANLARLAKGWDQPSVDAANGVLFHARTSAWAWSRFFHDHFAAHAPTPALFDYLGYPVFSWGSARSHERLQVGLATPLLERLEADLAVVAAAPGSLAKDEERRLSIFAVARFLDDLGAHGTIGSSAEIFEPLLAMVARYPKLLGAGRIDPRQRPYEAALRAQVHMALRETARPFDRAAREAVAGALGLEGRRKDLLLAHGTLLHDNGAFDRRQLELIWKFFEAVPAGLLSGLGHIEQHEGLGNAGPAGLWLRGDGLVNVFGTPIGQVHENGFPADVPASDSELFGCALAHEAMHVVDATVVERSAELKARRERLVRRAGRERQEYLRSIVDPELFQKAPQEFVASIANAWFADGRRTMELAAARLKAGRREPMAQALFFAEIFSLGGSTTRLFRYPPDGKLTFQDVPVQRDAAGRIVAVGSWKVDLDQQGDVLRAAK